MVELDELSRTLGNIEGKLESIEKTHNDNFPLLYRKIDKLDKAFDNHRIKMAYISGGIAAVTAFLVSYLKGVFK